MSGKEFFQNFGHYMAGGSPCSNSGEEPISLENQSLCRKEGTLVCARCRLVKYCSQECQKQDWRLHKKNCVNDDWLSTTRKFDIEIEGEHVPKMRLYVILKKAANFKKHGDVSVIMLVDTASLVANKMNYNQEQREWLEDQGNF